MAILHEKIKREIEREIENEKEPINKMKFGRIVIEVTIQDGQPHMFDIDIKKKRKCEKG